MAKGAAIKFTSYDDSVSRLLNLLDLKNELKKYDSIVLKVLLRPKPEVSTSKELTEQVLKFCLEHKNPVSNIFIVEGSDGYETHDLFDSLGFSDLAEKYDVGLVDLNNTETELIRDGEFLKFSEIKYPKILLNSFLISLSPLSDNDEFGMDAPLSSMLGAFPASYYSGFFSRSKTKLRKHPIKFSIHDSLKCKMPNFSLADASEEGYILAGLPLEIEKQALKILKKEHSDVPYLRILEESFSEKKKEEPIEL